MDDYKVLDIIITKNTSQHCKIFQCVTIKVIYHCVHYFMHIFCILTLPLTLYGNSHLIEVISHSIFHTGNILNPPTQYYLSKLSKVISLSILHSIIHTSHILSPPTSNTSTTDSLTPEYFSTSEKSYLAALFERILSLHTYTT